ncbi:MAG: hypothetical protein ABFC96_11740 [Thermoguttaceae bacterium]
MHPVRRATCYGVVAAIFTCLCVCNAHAASTALTFDTDPVSYSDGRSTTAYRLLAEDSGAIPALSYSSTSASSYDKYGMREARVTYSDGTYYLYYDGIGTNGFLACLATSTDLTNWTKYGAVLNLGAAGSPDSASASSPWLYYDQAASKWHMYYLATQNVNTTYKIPGFPYTTMQATSNTLSATTTWTKSSTIPLTVVPNTYYTTCASPGEVVKQGDQYLMFFSASYTDGSNKTCRTLGIARTADLDGQWTADASPILPATEQIENSALYYQKSTQTWYLFTNHVGINNGVEYTDAIWAYWTKDLNSWSTANKAVVLDGKTCSWSANCIGMPSVAEVADNKLAIFYDGAGGTSASHTGRSLALAYLTLPLNVATPTKVYANGFEGAKSLSGWVNSSGKAVVTPSAGCAISALPDSWTASASGQAGCNWCSSSNFSVSKDGATEGDICLYTNGNTTIKQTVAAMLQANTTYVLQVDVGRRSDLAWHGYRIDLLCGDQVLASTADPLAGGTADEPMNGQWITASLTYTTGSDVAAGQPIEIVLHGYGIQTCYDNVVLSSSAAPTETPEPGTLSLLIAGGVACLLAVRFRAQRLGRATPIQDTSSLSFSR